MHTRTCVSQKEEEDLTVRLLSATVTYCMLFTQPVAVVVVAHRTMAERERGQQSKKTGWVFSLPPASSSTTQVDADSKVAGQL